MRPYEGTPLDNSTIYDVIRHGREYQIRVQVLDKILMREFPKLYEEYQAEFEKELKLDNFYAHFSNFSSEVYAENTST